MKSIKMIAVAVALTLAGQAFAADWYVSPSGKNKNEGTSPSAPLKNIWKAIELASAGDAIHVAAGPGKPSKPSNKPDPGITIITPEDEKEEANPNTGAPVVCSFDLTAAGVVVLAATAAVLEIKRRK